MNNPFVHNAYILVLIRSSASGVPEVVGTGIFSEESPTIINPRMNTWATLIKIPGISYHDAHEAALEYITFLGPNHWIYKNFNARSGEVLPYVRSKR